MGPQHRPDSPVYVGHRTEKALYKIRVVSYKYTHSRGCVLMYKWPCLHVVMNTRVGFDHVLSARAHSLIMHCGSEHRIWLCAKGKCAEPLTTVQNHLNFIREHAESSEARNYPCINCTTQGLCHPLLKSLLIWKKTILHHGLLCRIRFEFRFLAV
jgi:hypothetical protein